MVDHVRRPCGRDPVVEVLLPGRSSMPWHHSTQGTNNGNRDNTAPDPWGSHLTEYRPPHAGFSRMTSPNNGGVYIGQLASVDTFIADVRCRLPWNRSSATRRKERHTGRSSWSIDLHLNNGGTRRGGAATRAQDQQEHQEHLNY